VLHITSIERKLHCGSSCDIIHIHSAHGRLTRYTNEITCHNSCCASNHDNACQQSSPSSSVEINEKGVLMVVSQGHSERSCIIDWFDSIRFDIRVYEEKLRVILAMTVHHVSKPNSTPGFFPILSSRFSRGDIRHTVQPHNRKNKAQTQHQHHNRINPETGALISVQLQHRPRRAASPSSACRRRPRIAQRFLVVCSSAAAQSGARAAGGGGRGWAVGARRRARRSGGGAAWDRGFAVGAGLGA
jgi:hypothetical protein